MEKQIILLQIGTDSKIESVYFWRSQVVCIPVLLYNLKILILESQDDFSWRRPLEITCPKHLLAARQTRALDQVVKGQIQSLELCPSWVEVQPYLQATCFVSLWIGEQSILQVPYKNLLIEMCRFLMYKFTKLLNAILVTLLTCFFWSLISFMAGKERKGPHFTFTVALSDQKIKK